MIDLSLFTSVFFGPSIPFFQSPRILIQWTKCRLTNRNGHFLSNNCTVCNINEEFTAFYLQSLSRPFLSCQSLDASRNTFQGTESFWNANHFRQPQGSASINQVNPNLNEKLCPWLTDDHFWKKLTQREMSSQIRPDCGTRPLQNWFLEHTLGLPASSKYSPLCDRWCSWVPRAPCNTLWIRAFAAKVFYIVRFFLRK